MTKRFEKAYNALCDAFFKGTLAKGTCTACACGNIVAAAMGESVLLNPEKIECSFGPSNWGTARTFDIYRMKYVPQDPVYAGHTQRNIEELTGYSPLEMCEIENAFEKTCKIMVHSYLDHKEEEILEDQYNGLCAVFEVLCELDNEEVNYKERLQTHPKLVLNAV